MEIEGQSFRAGSAQSKGGSSSSASGRSKGSDSDPGSAQAIAEAKKQRRLAKNRVTAAQSRYCLHRIKLTVILIKDHKQYVATTDIWEELLKPD